MTRETIDAIRVKFKSGDEDEFQKPDHDPHGETFAAAAHSFTTCDGDGCSEDGLVPTSTLEYADGYTGSPERDVLCSSCFEAHLGATAPTTGGA